MACMFVLSMEVLGMDLGFEHYARHLQEELSLSPLQNRCLYHDSHFSLHSVQLGL